MRIIACLVGLCALAAAYWEFRRYIVYERIDNRNAAVVFTAVGAIMAAAVTWDWYLALPSHH